MVLSPPWALPGPDALAVASPPSVGPDQLAPANFPPEPVDFPPVPVDPPPAGADCPSGGRAVGGPLPPGGEPEPVSSLALACPATPRKSARLARSSDSSVLDRAIRRKAQLLGNAPGPSSSSCLDLAGARLGGSVSATTEEDSISKAALCGVLLTAADIRNFQEFLHLAA